MSNIGGKFIRLGARFIYRWCGAWRRLAYADRIRSKATLCNRFEAAMGIGSDVEEKIHRRRRTDYYHEDK